ncbi:MAG: Ni/Fe hydrogenase subunit gamma, partial [candidate division Zixibacteria bacterium]|nr:Ni/Fe hydrogenase subunit gamma [candidate division Zixibacteria bacterium]
MASIKKSRKPQRQDLDDPMLVNPFRINRVIKETHDTFSLEISAAFKNGFNFAPGQFNMLYIFGVGEVPISISGDPEAREVLVHTTRAVGNVTK